MSQGFYKRRRGILDHLEAGAVSLLDTGIHDYLSLKMNSIKGGNSGIPPGVVFTSSRAIRALCPKGISERAIRRSLENLERRGWIKRWLQPGKHGNYAVLIVRSTVRDEAGNEYRVIGEETSDWRAPKLQRIEPSSTNRPSTRHELSTDKELRIKEAALKRSETPSHSGLWELLGVSPVSLPAEFRELCQRLYAASGEQSLFDFMGACLDGWAALGHRDCPAAFARAKAKLKGSEQTRPTPVAKPIAELTGAAWNS